MRIVDMDPDFIFKTMYEMGDIKSPRIKIDRKNKLIHGFSFDREVIEDTIKDATTHYEVTRCTFPSYMICLDFGDDETSFNVAAVALKLRFN